MENNVFKMLKEQTIPDIEFAYDALIKMVDKLYETYPDLKLTVKGVPNMINICATFNTDGRTFECSMHLIPQIYANGTPVAYIGMCEKAPSTREQFHHIPSGYTSNLKDNPTVNVDVRVNSAPVELSSTINNICFIDYGKKYKSIMKYDKVIKRYHNEAMFDWIYNFIKDLDKEMDDGGIPIDMDLESKMRYNEYDDEY